MAAHKHAALMLQYAQDAAETDRPWEQWEWKGSHSIDWAPIASPFAWYEDIEYRRKPKPLECWAVKNPDGTIYATTISEDAAHLFADGKRKAVRMREVAP